MTPAGVQIGAVWIPKRGRNHPSLVVRQIHRADRSCAVRFADGTRKELRWVELRKGWKFDGTQMIFDGESPAGGLPSTARAATTTVDHPLAGASRREVCRDRFIVALMVTGPILMMAGANALGHLLAGGPPS